MNRLKKYLLHGAHTRICMGCLTALLLLLACSSKDDGYTPLLREAEAVMENDADSALCMLEQAEGSYANACEAKRMRYRLLRAKAQNKAYVDFTSDEEMKQVVDYYDEHGSNNERMLAHFLMGCVYRDLGESPMALQMYYDAVSLADTTSADIDYRVLMSIYSQMSEIYHRQMLPAKILESLDRMCWYAKKTEDWECYARGHELKVYPYYMLVDREAVNNATEQAHDLYLRYGMQQEAYSVYPTAIDIALEDKDFESAKAMMTLYEEKSGLFDSCGNLPKSREQYYYMKGCYYLGMDDLDSAELYFRRIPLYETLRYDAYKGMLSLYQEKENIDSIKKYSVLLEAALDSVLYENQSNAALQIEGMYRYSRFQRETAESKMRAAESQRKLSATIAVGALLFSLLSCSIFFLLWRRHRKKQELKQIRMLYVEVRDQLDSKLSEIDEMEHLLDSQESVLRSSQEKAKELMGYVRKLSEEKVLKVYVNHSEELRSQDIVRRFYTYAKSTVDVVPKQDWEELYKAFEAFCPKLMIRLDTLSSHAEMTKSVCLLTLMGVRASDIANLVGMSVQSVSNARLQANKEFFGQASARTLRKNLEMEYNIYL